MSTTARNIRIEDDLWQRAGERAAAEGTNNSALIRQWLEDYAAGPKGSDALAYRPRPTLDDQLGELLGAFERIRAEIRKLTGDAARAELKAQTTAALKAVPTENVVGKPAASAKAAPTKATAR